MRAPLVAIPAGFPFYDGFESGTLGGEWITDLTYEGRIEVGSSYSYSGTYSLLLDDSRYDTIYSTAAAILTVDLGGQTEVELDFWWREFGDENDSEDGVFVSDDDGANWYQAFSFNDGPTFWRRQIIDLDEQAAAHGLTLNDHFQIKFQFYDNYDIPNDGYAIDEVQVRANAAPTLAWPGDTNYEQDGLHPESGDVSDNYVFRIRYADTDADPPDYVRVHIEKGGAAIAGSPFTMTCATGDYSVGVLCSYTKTGLEAGTDYTYCFGAQDDQGNPAAPTTALDAPDATITYKVYLPLVLRNAGPPAGPPVLHPVDNPGGHYNYTVSWGSVERATTYILEQDDNASFSNPNAVYDGPNTSASVAAGSVGTYFYRVKALNDFGSSAWSNIQSVVVTVAPPPCPQTGTWSGNTSQGTSIHFTVSNTPRCQVESLVVYYRICGHLVRSRFYDTYPISNDHFRAGGSRVDWVTGDFTSRREANGEFLFELMCPTIPPIPDLSSGTWTATHSP